MDIKPKKFEYEKLMSLSISLNSTTPQSLNDIKYFTNVKVTVNVVENPTLKLLIIWETMRCFPQNTVSVSSKFIVFDVLIDLASVTLLLLE